MVTQLSPGHWRSHERGAPNFPGGERGKRVSKAGQITGGECLSKGLVVRKNTRHKWKHKSLVLTELQPELPLRDPRLLS